LLNVLFFFCWFLFFFLFFFCFVSHIFAQFVLLVLLLAVSHADGQTDWRAIQARSAVPNLDLAKNLLLSCYTNYCGSESNATKACYWCLKVPGYIDGSLEFLSRFGDASTGTSGMVVYCKRDKYVAVIWQGTSNVDGAVVDGGIFLARVPGSPWTVRAHTGFQSSVARAANQVYGIVQTALQLCGPQCRLIVTGHSLGGSLVYPSALVLARQTKGSVPMEIYAFGAARHFNRAGGLLFCFFIYFFYIFFFFSNLVPRHVSCAQWSHHWVLSLR
jgi:hypothetical protein